MINLNFSKYRRPLTVFCVFILTTLAVCGSDDGKITCRSIKAMETGKSSIEKELKCSFLPPIIFYYSTDDWNSETRQLKIHSINSTTNNKDSFLITLPEMITINYLPKVAIGENFLILTDDNRFDNFRYEKKGNSFHFLNKIILPAHSTADRIQLLKNNKFLFQSIYNYHPEDKVHNTNLGVYDADKDIFINFIHPELPCIGFSHFANNWTASNGHLIALAYPCSYQIILYDFNLNPIDTIKYKPDGWSDLKDNIIPCETSPAKINPKLLIDKLKPMQDSINRIEKIYFIDQSKLMIVSTGNMEEGFRRIDLFHTNQWKKPIKSYDKCKIKYSINDTIQLNNLPIVLSNPRQYLLKEGMIYSVSDDDFNLIDKISFNEFNHQKDLYYENHDPQFTIGIYKINIP